MGPDLHAPRPVAHVFPQQEIVQAAGAEEVEHLKTKWYCKKSDALFKFKIKHS